MEQPPSLTHGESLDLLGEKGTEQQQRREKDLDKEFDDVEY